MSSLKDLASLIMIPSLYKDGRLDTVKPLGNSIIHPDATGNNDGTDGSTPAEGNFTFSRGSNLAATRVDVNGLIEKGRENLVLASNDFDNGTYWNQFATATGGEQGYDGSNDAFLLSKNATSYKSIQQLVVSSGVLTFSVYAKAGTLNQVTLFTAVTSGGSNPYATFNLTNGVVVSSASTIDTSSEQLTNGWWRFSITINGTTADARVYADFGETNAGNIYIQDAQLEAGLVATSVIETGASTAQAGILEDMPRLDYSGGASCPALLLEPQRTNIFNYSEYFGAADWLKASQGSAAAPVVTDNYAISPEGLRNASRVQFDAVGTNSLDRSGLVRQFAFTTGTTYTISCWVKATSGNSELVQFRIAGQQVGGELTATDEWQRLSVTSTASVTTTDDFGLQVRGNNTTNSSDILIYGMQLESASYPTSYIPTYGSSVTRSADDFVLNLATNIVQNGGTFMLELEGSPRGSGSSVPFLQFTHTNSASYVGFGATGNWRCRINDNGTSRLVTSPVLHEDDVKLGIRYGDFGYEYYANGSSFSTYNTAIDIGDFSSVNFIVNENYGILRIKQIVTFPTALTDSEAIALTTL